MKKQFSGWLVAAVLLGIMAGLGFQGSTEKTGVVDLNRVVSDSDMGKKASKQIQDAYAVRDGLLTFVSTYMLLTTDQAAKLRDLTLKPTPTEADKNEIDRIKKDVMDADKKRTELLQKATPTEAERLALQDYANRSKTMSQTLDRWQQEFQSELSQMEQTVRESTLAAVRTTLKDMAKQQGYSVVLESTVAPYGANDLTEGLIKALNAKG
ncbi:MAG: OmpH family outer membrane protein [Armatimonadetes bacterium]|nr:OmpH family outer membrane protein [Armatimonadota bacterium]